MRRDRPACRADCGTWSAAAGRWSATAAARSETPALARCRLSADWQWQSADLLETTSPDSIPYSPCSATPRGRPAATHRS